MSAAIAAHRSADDRVRDVRRWLAAAREVHAQRAELAPSVARSTGLSLEGVALGFESLEREATEDELRALVASAGDASHVHVILSANVFIAPLRAIAIARAASNRVTVKPSSRDPILARALVAAARDPAVTVHEDPTARLDATRIDVYGRDETVARVRASVRPGVVVRGHGAGLGVAFVALGRPTGGARGPRSDVAASAESLAVDVVPFDQRGCLSPRLALVEGERGHAEAFATALHEALARWATRAPRGSLAEGEGADAARWRDTMAFAGRTWVGDQHMVALAEPGLPFALPPPGRHVLVVPVASGADARRRIEAVGRFVVTVGASDLEGAAEVATPGVRLARLGRMQHPPLDGPVDRRSL